MAQELLVVSGYKEFIAAATKVGGSINRDVRDAFRQVGEDVRADASRRFSRYSTKSAAGFKVRVRQRGVSVEQSLRKTTGLRPDYGKLQMRKGLLPALDDNEKTIEREMDKALEKALSVFNR